MSNYKNINLKLLSLSLFTAVGLHNINQASPTFAQTFEDDQIVSSAQAANKNVDFASTILELNKNTNTIESDLLSNTPNQSLQPTENSSKDLEFESLESESFLISRRDSAFSFEGFDFSRGTSANKTLRLVSVSLFLLLFVPFGIFYPFFLFYRRLLNNRRERVNLRREREEFSEPAMELADAPASKLPITSFSPETLKLEESTDNIQAAVSQLQIAFAVEDDSLKHKLAELCSNVDSRTDQGIAELMRKTISLLINEDEWTHVSHTSECLTVDKITTEFEKISTTERSKFPNEELNPEVDEEQTEKKVQTPKIPVVKNTTNYIVVTLILCTSHTEPLFSEIRTKKQLLEELSELGKMRQSDLIKFDLLWNPQGEEQYLNNNELLVNYIDMMRLF